MRNYFIKGGFVLTLLVLFISLAHSMYFEVLEFRELGSDFTADREFVQDTDQRVSAALRYDIEPAVDISLRERVYKSATIDGNKYLFFSVKEPQLTIEAAGYEALVLNPPDHAEFITGKVYYLRARAREKVSLTFHVNPPDAQVLLNGEPWQGQRFMPGEYVISIHKDGYEHLSDTIIVSSTSTVFTYELTPEAVSLTINVSPPDAVIYIGNSVWETNTQHITPGDYQILLEAEGYETMFQTVNIAHDDMVLDYVMEPITIDPVVSGTTPTMTGDLPSITAFDYHFLLTSSEAIHDNSVIIKAIVTNMSDEDRELTITRNTKFFDNMGREWQVNNVNIGNKDLPGYSVTHRLISNIPTELTLTFRDVQRNAAQVSLLEIMTTSGKIQMRNFPIQR